MQVMPDWMEKPLLDINKGMVVKRHQQHGEKRSQARANLAMRVLRAIFNFATEEYENAKGRPIITDNPVKRLSHNRAWYRIEKRHNVIKKHDLATWYQGLQKLSHRLDPDKADMMKDYFLLVLFTGLRRQEAATLQWRDVDLKARTLTIADPKNRERHTLPLSDFLYDLMVRRKMHSDNQYVFPADSRTGHLHEPRKAMLKVAELSGVAFTVHDLRRTFITIAESLAIPVYALKRLLNHTTANDVTAGYIILDVERLREPMQKISDTIRALMQAKA